MDQFSKQLTQLLSKHSLAKAQVRTESQRLAEAEDHLTHCEQAQEIVQAVAQQVQQQAHNKIAAVVTRCLTAIFDHPYKFKIIFERKRGKTEARLVFTRKKSEIDPISASGGGVVDVAAFALRLSCLLLSQPPRRRVLVMDEPFKFVSEEYRPQVRLLLEKLSEELKVQFILVTHITELQVGQVVRID